MANYKLNVQIKRQSAAFLKGFSQIIAPESLRMFSQEEVQTIICGNPGGIDFADMQKYVTYSGGYSATHPVIQRFWNVISTLTVAQQEQFLVFVTSCSRVRISFI
jgi:ubiquitin-protein ligase E3 C